MDNRVRRTESRVRLPARSSPRGAREVDVLLPCRRPEALRGAQFRWDIPPRASEPSNVYATAALLRAAGPLLVAWPGRPVGGTGSSSAQPSSVARKVSSTADRSAAKLRNCFTSTSDVRWQTLQQKQPARTSAISIRLCAEQNAHESLTCTSVSGIAQLPVLGRACRNLHPVQHGRFPGYGNAHERLLESLTTLQDRPLRGGRPLRAPVPDSRPYKRASSCAPTHDASHLD
jgi:hypothetical protein